MGFNLKVLSLLAALIGTWLVPVHAQTAASSQPIRIIVPYAAGGLVDVMNRILASRMAQTLGQPVIVENKPGANANIGPAFVAQAEPDGLTLLATASYFSANPLIEANLQWDPKKLVPIARFAASPNLFVVPSSSPAKSLSEYLALAKASAAGLPVLDAGRGAPQSMVQYILQDKAHVRFSFIPYKGGTQYVPDLITGTLSGGVIPFNVALELIKGGQLRGLAITSRERSSLLPDVPTMAEAGYEEASVESWLGLHAPIGTPAATLRRLASAVEEAAKNAEVRTKFANLGANNSFLDTSNFEAFLTADQTRARRVWSLVGKN
jgi:tripartite-type tricarboxylate transporter receptor subunit TctC